MKWTYFFNDIYKPAPGRVGNAAKNLFYRWVYDNIHLDRPYNEVVSEMLTANATSNWYYGPASYVARWVVTAVSCDDEVHEDTSDELAIHATKDFLGVDISCASCHDGAVISRRSITTSASGSAKRSGRWRRSSAGRMSCAARK